MIATERRINLWLVITGVLAAAFAVAAFMFPGQSLGSAKEDDQTFPLCEYISIDLLKTDVTLIPWDEDEIRFTYRNDVPLEVELGDNSLAITEGSDFVISLFNQEQDYGMYLYLPREYYRDILIYTVSGDVILGDVDSEKITVVTNSGYIASRDTRSLCSLTTGSGDIMLDFYSVIPGSSVQTRGGNAEIVFPRGSSVALDFETTTGELRTDLISGAYSGSYKYSFNGGAKQIHAALETGVLTVSEK
ncbi:MAG: DUF4097 family beta strand repeat-containing protein [Oscillospiraceae bacterium]